MEEISIVDLNNKVVNGIKYAILFKKELLLGFYTKEDADSFEAKMPRNKYNRMACLKISIKILN